MVFAAFPRSGPPPRFRDYAEYAEVVGQLEKTGCIADYTHIWWDIRPHPRLGTVEVRICDAVTRLEDAIAITAFVQSLVKLLSERLPITIYLDVIVLVISVPVGVLLGVTSATKRGKPVDNIISVLANIFSCVPIFWLGLLLIYLFSVQWHLLPTYGFTWPGQDLGLSLKQSVMPVLVMTLTSLSPLARQSRSSMLETINQDYIRTARSKGLKRRDVINKHALKNALIPVVTLLGIRIGFLLGGSPLVETVYSIPGMGSLLVKCLAVKDTPVIQACVLLTAAIICIVNLLVDILYGYIDPRIRVN
jgi:peptide/nickel transport system permease protein